MRLRDIELDPKRADMITADEDGADVLVTSDVRVGRGVLHLGNGVHCSTPFAFLGIMQDQIADLSLTRMEGVPRCLGLLADRRSGIPPRNQEKVVESGPVMLSVQHAGNAT